MMNKNTLYETIVLNDFIRLNGNESSRNISKEMLEEVLKDIKSIEFNRYPEDSSIDLKLKYARYANVSEENIIVGNGSDEMLSLVISSCINKGDKVLTVNPDFSMYDFYINLNEGEIVKLDCNEDGGYKIEDFIKLGLENSVKLILFSNPNNPTGNSISNEDIIKILNSFKDTIVLVDEAYYEFNDESIVDEINNYKNLLITRTLSKAWGGAALRVGFLIGNKDRINILKSNKVPYNVNSLSQIIASKILDDREEMINTVNEVKKERARVYKELKYIEKNTSKIKFYKSKGNYIFGRSSNKKELFNVLKENKISIRSFNDDTFRVTIGSIDENNKFLEVIRGCFK